MCYLWGNTIGREHSVLAVGFTDFIKNLFSFTVMFVKLCSLSSKVHLTVCYWTRWLDGVSGNWQGKYVIVQLLDTFFFKSCAWSKKFSLPNKSAVLVGFFELFSSRKCILFRGFHQLFKDTMNGNIFITISRKTQGLWSVNMFKVICSGKIPFWSRPIYQHLIQARSLILLGKDIGRFTVLM